MKRTIIAAACVSACLAASLALAQQANGLYRPAPKLPEPKYRE